MRPPTINVGTAAPGTAPRSRQPYRVLLAAPVDPGYRPVRVSLDLSELTSSETVLTGLLEDRSPALGVLAQIEVLGLELVELRQIARDRHRVNQALTAQRTACEATGTSLNPKSRK